MYKRNTTGHLDDKGRCCGIKPIVYKRDPHLFCHRCCRAFDPDTGSMIENWAWKFKDGRWQDQTMLWQDGPGL